MTTNKANINLEEYEEYTPRELEFIDKYIALSNNTLEDEEVYDIIIKYNFDEERIRQAVLDHVAILNKKGNDFAWTAIAKGGRKVKTQETAQPAENKQKNNKNQRRNRENHFNYTQQYQDQGNHQDFQENRRGARGNRRGRVRGTRGNRGGKRNNVGNFVETHFDQPQTNAETNTLNTLNTNPVETLHEDTTSKEIQNNVETLIQDTPNSKPSNTSDQNQLINSNPTSNSIATNNNPSSLHPHEIQNVETLFQKFTIERESEVNQLLEEKKPVKVERDPKAFYEECVNHYIRDLAISHGSPVSYKGVIKPVQQQPKHTINQQPQLNLNQTTIPQQNQNIPTNKNFPQKGGFGQPSQAPENYFNPQMMYPFMYGNQGMDTNMPNPNFFPQMNMLYFMNQMYQQQQHFMNQSQMDPEYLESMKAQKGGRSHAYQPRENMGFNAFFPNQGGNQPDSQGYMRPDNYYGYGGEK